MRLFPTHDLRIDDGPGEQRRPDERGTQKLLARVLKQEVADMTLLHNAITRGFNTIYLQAPHVRDADTADFVDYALTWHTAVEALRAVEVGVLFPAIEMLLHNFSLSERARRECGMTWRIFPGRTWA